MDQVEQLFNCYNWRKAAEKDTVNLTRRVKADFSTDESPLRKRAHSP